MKKCKIAAVSYNAGKDLLNICKVLIEITKIILTTKTNQYGVFHF